MEGGGQAGGGRNEVDGMVEGLIRGFRDYFCCGISQPLIIRFRSPVHDCNVTNRAGQKRADHVTLRQALGVSGKFPEIIFSVFNSLAFTEP